MPDISLRFKIILLFCLLGVLPQVVISYVSVDAYTRSLEETHEKKVSQLVDQVARQTAIQLNHLVEDLRNQAAQPYLQLSFQQYPQKIRLQLLKERLELYRTSGKVFTRLHLCYLNGERLVGSSIEGRGGYSKFERDVIVGNRELEAKPYLRLYPAGDELAIFLPVNSFRQQARVVGILVAYLPVETMTRNLENVDFGEHTIKNIRTAEGEKIELQNGGTIPDSPSDMRSYSSKIDPSGWEILIRISEQELFHDVIVLKRKNTLFIVASIILAFGAWFIISHGFTRPLREILEGSQVFATGNLDHRISVSSGYEARRLATAFNDMARQLKERQEELNQSARLASLGVMTAGLAHEIKNPLAGIKTSAQVMHRILDPGDGSAEGKEKQNQLSAEDLLLVGELAQGLSEETDRLTKLLNDMLEFGRPRKPNPKVFDLADTVNHAISLVRPEQEKRSIRIVNNVGPHKVFADSDQVLQVLLNLLNNGIQAVDDLSGRIELESTAGKSGVVLRIRDNGSGIPEDKLQRIFDPFFSLTKGGTGLGLSVVYTLLKQNDASLEVFSTEGEGTEFTIIFQGTAKYEETIDD